MSIFKPLLFSTLVLVSFLTYASENYNLKKEQAKKALDYELCVAQNRNACVDEVCLTSEEPDCQEDCKAKAEVSCKP